MNLATSFIDTGYRKFNSTLNNSLSFIKLYYLEYYFLMGSLTMAASANEIQVDRTIGEMLVKIKQLLQPYLSIFNVGANHKDAVTTLLSNIENQAPPSALVQLVMGLIDINTTSDTSKLRGIQRKIEELLTEDVSPLLKAINTFEPTQKQDWLMQLGFYEIDLGECCLLSTYCGTSVSRSC